MEFLPDVRKLHVENGYPKIPYDRRNEFQCSHCYKIFPIRGLMNAYWAPFEGFTGYWIKEVICNRCYVQALSDNTINEYNVCIPEEDIYAPQELEILYEPNNQEIVPVINENCLLLDMQEPTMNETITYYNAVREPTHYYLENMDQNNENYSDPLSHEDKNVLPMDSEYYLGVKKKTQQRIGRQVSFNLRTSQVLKNNEPCQLKQRDSTHMGPVHCVNRKRKKKRTSQGLSRIELQHVKMKNLQPLLNLFRLLVHYII